MPPDPPTDLEERLTHLDRLLDEGLELGSTDQEAWLARVRSADPALAEALAELLAREAEIDAAGFLQHPAPVQPHVTSLAGRRIGAYTLERPLGRGGMGTVWLARRSDGRFEGRAAIKLLNLPLLDAAGAERFRREATALARLAHPNIARLIDAGVAEDGQPYLVLEYVDGVRIDRYADERRLSPTDRIALLLQVLDAVGHAHANLIVHRDIKPSNLLVTADGTVKLLDFGIAKLLAADGEPGGRSQLTDAAGSALTPEFAAPEQVTSGAISVATDVYSLGVLMYLLLSGRHPTGDGAATTAEHIQRLVEATPSRVSVAAGRAAAPERIRRLFRGDIDTIAARALKKSPAERYATVPGFADDLRRFLRHEPVHARPDTLTYRARKFLRRNRLAVAGGALVAGLLMGTTVFALLQLGEARRQRDDARAQRDHSRLEERRVFASSVFMQTLIGSLGPTARGLTTDGLLRQARGLLDRPIWGDLRVRARLLIDLADQHAAQQQVVVSDSLLRRAESVADSAADGESAAMAECRMARAGATNAIASASLARARRHLRRVPEPGAEVRSICLLAEARVAGAAPDAAERSLSFLQKAVAIEAESGDSLSVVADWTLYDLANVYSLPVVHRLRTGRAMNARRLAIFRETGREETAASFKAVLLGIDFDEALGEYLAAESLYASLPDVAWSDIPNVTGWMQPDRALLDASLGRLRSAARVFLALRDSAVIQGHPGLEKYFLGCAITFLSDAGLVRAARALFPRFRALPAIPEWLGADLAYAAEADAEGDHATAIRWERVLIGRTGLARGAIKESDVRLVLRMSRSSLAGGDPIAADSFARYAIDLATRIGQDSAASGDIGRAFVVLGHARLALADTSGAVIALRRGLPGLAGGLGYTNSETSAARRLSARLAGVAPRGPGKDPVSVSAAHLRVSDVGENAHRFAGARQSTASRETTWNASQGGPPGYR